MTSQPVDCIRRRVHVTGRVQGVGFRYFVQSVARNLGLAGWVRNDPDGSVICEAQGVSANVEQLLLHLRAGPAMAEVTSVDIAELPIDPQLVEFAIERRRG